MSLSHQVSEIPSCTSGNDMVHVRTGSVDDMDSDEDFGIGRTTEWLPPTSLTERERLLRRLHEVKR